MVSAERGIGVPSVVEDEARRESRAGSGGERVGNQILL
jgi:hypothetical protein